MIKKDLNAIIRKTSRKSRNKAKRIFNQKLLKKDTEIAQLKNIINDKKLVIQKKEDQINQILEEKRKKELTNSARKKSIINYYRDIGYNDHLKMMCEGYIRNCNIRTSIPVPNPNSPKEIKIFSVNEYGELLNEYNEALSHNDFSPPILYSIVKMLDY